MAAATRRAWLATVALLVPCACASSPDLPDTFGLDDTSAQESTPLGGEALALRKRKMQRAQRDMGHFHATLETLHERRDRSGLILFSRFVDRYMGEHLDPMLRGEWQSNHPELMALDASLRLTQADVLIQLRAPRRVQGVLDEISRRFPGRESMLVEYPIGAQTTLDEAMRRLRDRKWRG